MLAEETDDLAVDASAADVKAALEALTYMGTVNVTREDLGSDLYAWSITFTEPTTSAYSNSDSATDIDTATGLSLVPLSFPLLYAGGEDWGGGLGLGTLGTGGEINATRLQRGTLGPLSGEVRIAYQTVYIVRLLPTAGGLYVLCVATLVRSISHAWLLKLDVKGITLRECCVDRRVRFR